MLVELITDYKPILTFQMDCLQREINNFSKDLESQTSLSTEAESIYKKIRTYVDPIHENKISQYEKENNFDAIFLCTDSTWNHDHK